jgi:Holliday junction resolvase RusA-like endonuclease
MHKSRQTKAIEYEEKYARVPKDFRERLDWMYDKYKVTDKKALEILNTRDSMIRDMYYETIKVILYEDPEGSPRPRFRLVNRYNLSDVAKSNSSFVHVYSITGKEDNAYMKRLVSSKDFEHLDGLICTPCDVEYRVYFKTPSSFNITQKFLCEMGLIRHIVKPDWDNIGKKYSDMYNGNVWIDDTLTVDGTVRKFYSELPRVEINLMYMNMVYTKQQYKSIINRVDYSEDFNLNYFGSEDKYV